MIFYDGEKSSFQWINFFLKHQMYLHLLVVTPKVLTFVKKCLLSSLLRVYLSLGIRRIVYLFKSQNQTFILCDTFTLPVLYYSWCRHWSVSIPFPNQHQLYVYVLFIFLKRYNLLSWFSESNVKLTPFVLVYLKVYFLFLSLDFKIIFNRRYMNQ